MTTSGIVFNLQRFSLHDGPGIRTTVFLKGCPLNCAWCANPESQSPRPQLMTRDIKCCGCGACAKACPEGAVQLEVGKVRRILWEQCTHCFRCVAACLYGALAAVGQTMTVEAVLDIVKKDQVFYDQSGGGLTLSGGEPLTQPTFARELLKGAKATGLHTVMDTTGHAPPTVLESILPFVDLTLYDIKHLDPQRHRRATGVDNQLILQNLKRTANQTRTWLRIPLLHGYNDTPEHMEGLARLVKELNIEKISLLPYHEGGLSKCRQIGQTPLDFMAQSPSEAHLAHLMEIMTRHGVRAAIGA